MLFCSRVLSIVGLMTFMYGVFEMKIPYMMASLGIQAIAAILQNAAKK